MVREIILNVFVKHSEVEKSCFKKKIHWKEKFNQIPYQETYEKYI